MHPYIHTYSAIGVKNEQVHVQNSTMTPHFSTFPYLAWRNVNQFCPFSGPWNLFNASSSSSSILLSYPLKCEKIFAFSAWHACFLKKKKASEKVKATFIFEKLDMLKGSHILTEILNERDELNFTNLWSGFNFFASVMSCSMYVWHTYFDLHTRASALEIKPLQILHTLAVIVTYHLSVVRADVAISTYAIV